MLKQFDGRGGDRTKSDGTDTSAPSQRDAAVHLCHCGEDFDLPVWHCPKCHHHWGMDREDCHNCYDADRPDEPTTENKDGAAPNYSQADAARDAGMSERQTKTAVRVANVPQDEYDELVESEEPQFVGLVVQQRFIHLKPL